RDATATATRCFSATATATTEIYTLSLHDALPGPDTLGAARAPPAGDRARAAAEVRRAARRQGLSHQSAVPRAVGPLQAGGIRDHEPGVVPGTGPHGRRLPGRAARLSRAAEPR